MNVDLDGVPLQSYAFFLGCVPREVAEAGVTSVGQIGVRLSSNSQIWLVIRSASGAAHMACTCDPQRRLWSASVPLSGGGASKVLSGASLPVLARAVHAALFGGGGGPAAYETVPSTPDAGFELAQKWKLAQLPCFYTSPAHDELLTSAPVSYLIRTSTTSADSLVLVVRDASGALRRMLFKQLGPTSWQSGTNAPTIGTFAEFLRALLPPLAVPLNDPLRVVVAAAPAAQDDSFERRAQSYRDAASTTTAPSRSNPLLPQPTPRRSRFNGAESNEYLSVSAALAFARDNADLVRDGTVWAGVARKEALASMDSKHNDIDGVSLASEPFYFYDLDTFGANALLAQAPAGTYLVRLNSTMTQFVLSLARAGGQVGHMLLAHNAARRTIQAPGGLAYSSVRELAQKTPALVTPLSRAAVDCEFVDCAIELRAHPLGVGAGGQVLRGRIKSGAPLDVAVKRLVSEGDHGGSGEAEAMLKVPPHPNVARLFGLVLKPMSLVVEFCDGGSLDQLLGIETDAPGTVLSAAECVQVALGVARGVAHLHAAQVVHRDLASRNILITRPLVPKVSDFGLSRVLHDQEAVTGAMRGPVKWMAPEQLRGARVHSYKSDVFSFAVLLTEIVNNALPWPAEKNQDAAALVAVQGKRTPINARVSPLLRSVIQQCWAQRAEERPTMARVVELLSSGHNSHYDDVV